MPRLRHSSQRALRGAGLTMRNATHGDLDDIVNIVHLGFPDDPEVDYRFPRRDSYPYDYLKWTRREYEGYLDQPDKYVVHVIVATRPVALAVWDVAVLTPAKNTDMGLNQRRDANKGHCQIFNDRTSKCFTQYFADYAEKQIHLWLIVTHPDFRRRGAAKMLMQWGLDNQRCWPVTVFASPMGQLLYEYLHFERLAVEHIRVEDEEEQLTFAVMERHLANDIAPFGDSRWL